jgi:hypothetical protein
MIKDEVTSRHVVENEVVSFQKFDDLAGLTAGSFGILEVQGGNQRFVVGRDWLLVFFQALDVPGYGIPCHPLGFCERPAKRHTSRQSWHDGRESAFRFGPEDNIEVAVRFLHWFVPILSESPEPGQIRS